MADLENQDPWFSTPNSVVDDGYLPKMKLITSVKSYMVLRRWMGVEEPDVAWRTLEDISADIGHSKGSTSRGIAELLALKLVEIKEKGKRERATRYRLCNPMSCTGATETGCAGATQDPRKVAPVEPMGCAGDEIGCADGGQRVAPADPEIDKEEDYDRGKTTEKTKVPRRGKKPTAQEVLPPIPSTLQTPAFEKAWAEWQEFRSKKKKPLTALAAKLQFADFDAWGVDRAIVSIHTSIKAGWQGCFEPKETKNGNHNYQPKRKPAVERGEFSEDISVPILDLGAREDVVAGTGAGAGERCEAEG